LSFGFVCISYLDLLLFWILDFKPALKLTQKWPKPV
jgi:hypothetical protein